MAFLGIGKKKEEDFDEEDGFTEEEELQDRKLTRKFKDLSPENKKKRKEPPKPWGKKERLIILIAMLITILISGILFLMSNNNFQFKIDNLQISKPDFSHFNIFKEETIEIRKK
ncbi:MAG TPA: hypothetical protein VKC53_03610 [Patescibacteria group bacterium]|nr:hypothetical protein [Patescibacteria group bacterium]